MSRVYVLISYLFFKALQIGFCPSCLTERAHWVPQCLPYPRTFSHFFCVIWCSLAAYSFLKVFPCLFFLLSLSFGSSRPLPFFFRFLSWPLFLQKTTKDWCFLVFPSQNSLFSAHQHPPLQLSPAANPHHTPTSSRPVCSTVGCLFGHIILPTGHWNTPSTSYSTCLKEKPFPFWIISPTTILQQQKVVPHSCVLYLANIQEYFSVTLFFLLCSPVLLVTNSHWLCITDFICSHLSSLTP